MKYQIDIETLSTKKNAVIMSIGICNEEGKGDQFYLPIARQHQMGRDVDAKTMAWWNEPERIDYYHLLRDECQNAYDHQVEIADAHKFIRTFLHVHDNDEPREIWMNSPAFDGVILEDLFMQFALDIPWHYRDPRCFRTLKKLALKKNPDVILPKPPAGLHDALIDCQWQMLQTHFYLSELGL